MATSIGPTYDPASTAAALAEKYTMSRQGILKTQNSQATAAAKGLSTLNSAITAYQSSLSLLTGLNKTMLSRSAAFTDTTIGSASASATATAGTYSFFVERLATASQVSYAAVPDSPANGGAVPPTNAGSLDITLAEAVPSVPPVPGVTFTVDLTTAGTDADGDGILSVRELAAAINGAPGNASQVSASVVTIQGVAQLVLTGKNTGAANSLSLDATKVNNPDLQAALSAAPKVMATAQDAVVWLGAKGSGTSITQASNTFTNVDGVKMTFTRAQGAGESPVTLTVAADDGGTRASVQAFIDAYNKLKEAVDGLAASGDPAKGQAAGVFAQDSGVKVLQGRLVSMLRQTGSASLAAFGITANREGTLTLDAARLTRQTALDPAGLDKLIGSASAGSGIAGKLDTYLKEWSSNVNGHIKLRREANDKLQTELTKRQDKLDTQYDSAYQRYLLQFTRLQSLQSQMTSNTSLFDALFGAKSN